jgi:hypothetical protein
MSALAARRRSGFEFDGVAASHERRYIARRQRLAQQAERLTQALACLRLAAVLPQQRGELGPFVRPAAVVGQIRQQRLCLPGRQRYRASPVVLALKGPEQSKVQPLHEFPRCPRREELNLFSQIYHAMRHESTTV